MNIEVAGRRESLMETIDRLAPSDERVIEYDRRHLALYAALLDAADASGDWRDAASLLMRLDVTRSDAEACWRSHLERARWIVNDGLGSALIVFNKSRGVVKKE